MFSMPPILVGESVYFYRCKGDRPALGIVVMVGNSQIQVMVLVPYNVPILVDGVRHASDPDLERGEVHRDGFWDYTPWTQWAHENVLPGSKGAKESSKSRGRIREELLTNEGLTV